MRLGGELGVAVPHHFRAWRITLALEVPSEAGDQKDSVSEGADLFCCVTTPELLAAQNRSANRRFFAAAFAVRRSRDCGAEGCPVTPCLHTALPGLGTAMSRRSGRLSRSWHPCSWRPCPCPCRPLPLDMQATLFILRCCTSRASSEERCASPPGSRSRGRGKACRSEGRSRPREAVCAQWRRWRAPQRTRSALW